ncbi:MAG: hypothetical protein R2762_14990 [Bryobacteraceae bacterium]
MESPWLGVPLDDYEGHMNAPEVAQLGALAALFAMALELAKPRSVAILGVAGGNGLSALDPARAIRPLDRPLDRIVGIDIHPQYLDAVARRYPNLPGLELHRVDLANARLEIPPVELVHAALIFEHAGTRQCLDNAIALVQPAGRLSVVLQVASGSHPNVSATPFASLQALSADFRLVEPSHFCDTLADRGFVLDNGMHQPLPAGKAFWFGMFTRSSV